MTSTANQRYAEWVDELAARNRFGSGDRIGTANLIDDAARKRAAEAIRTGSCISLARPITDEKEGDYSVVSVDVWHGQVDAFTNRPPFAGVVDTGADVAHIGAHGQTHTHLDAINHIGREGKWYSGFPVDDLDGPCVADLANHILFTRAVLADIPAVRGTDWVDPAEPVTGDDIDGALAQSGTDFLPGDALLLYMGRDRYERAGHSMDVAAGRATPGAGWGAARWIAEHDVSILCWDFLDAVHDDEPVFQVHLLIWAIGLLLVDNANLSPAASAAKERGVSTGALVVATPPLPRATGALVQPLFIQ
jgi:kynurenine formamidase